MLNKSQIIKFVLISGATLSLVACESTGSLRLASVGNVPGGDTASGGSSGGDTGSSSSGGASSSSSGGGSSSSSSGGSTASSGGGSSSGGLGARNIIVTAGNTVIGVAGTTRRVGNGVLLPATGLVTGTVTRILRKTGQTLVDIGQGNTLILGRAGGVVGDLLRIDLASHTVVGAPNRSALLGVAVLSPGGPGNLVAVSLNRALDLTSTTTGGLLQGGLSNGLTGSLTGGLTGNVSGGATASGSGTAVPSTPVSGVTNTVGGVVGGVVNTTTGVLGGLGTAGKKRR